MHARDDNYRVTVDAVEDGVGEPPLDENVTRLANLQQPRMSRIPRSFAAEAQVEEGTTVDLSVEDGRLLVPTIRV